MNDQDRFEYEVTSECWEPRTEEEFLKQMQEEMGLISSDPEYLEWLQQMESMNLAGMGDDDAT